MIREFIESYQYNDEKVQKYQKRQRILDNDFLIMLALVIIAVIFGGLLSNYGYNQNWSIGLFVVLVSIYIYVLISLIDEQNKENISERTLQYYHIAKALDVSQNDLEKSIEHLKKVDENLSNTSIEIAHPKREKELKRFVEATEVYLDQGGKHDIAQESIRQFFEEFTSEILAVENNDFVDYVDSAEIIEEDEIANRSETATYRVVWESVVNNTDQNKAIIGLSVLIFAIAILISVFHSLEFGAIILGGLTILQITIGIQRSDK